MCYPRVSSNIYWQKRRLISESFAKQHTNTQITFQHISLQGGCFISLQGGIDRFMKWVSWSPEACQPSSDMFFQIIQLLRSIWKSLFWCLLSFIWPLLKTAERILFAEKLRCPKVIFNALLTFRQLSGFSFGSVDIGKSNQEAWNYGLFGPEGLICLVLTSCLKRCTLWISVWTVSSHGSLFRGKEAPFFARQPISKESPSVGLKYTYVALGPSCKTTENKCLSVWCVIRSRQMDRDTEFDPTPSCK